MPIYMEIDGVPGNVTEANHTNWIECATVGWGVGRSINTPVGAAADREGSAASISEVTVTKPLDESSNSLFALACAKGTGNGKIVKIHITKSGDETGMSNYAEYELTDTLISGYSVNSAGDRPVETVSFNYTKIMQKTEVFNADLSAKGPASKTFDIPTATVS